MGCLADGPQIFVPLDIAGGRADADDVQPAIAVDIGRGAARAGHSAVIDDLVIPLLPAIVLRIEYVHSGTLGAAIAGGDIVEAVAVEIAHYDFVSLRELGKNH